MPQAQLQPTADRAAETTAIHERWQQVKTHLEAQQEAICNEIYSYPPPIPACDEQYNYLLERRTQVKRELRRLDALLPPTTAPDEWAAALEKFVHASSFLDEDTAFAR